MINYNRDIRRTCTIVSDPVQGILGRLSEKMASKKTLNKLTEVSKVGEEKGWRDLQEPSHRGPCEPLMPM